MDVISAAEARRVLKELEGWVLYLYSCCEMYKLVKARVIAVKRLRLDVEDLVEALRTVCAGAPRV